MLAFVLTVFAPVVMLFPVWIAGRLPAPWKDRVTVAAVIALVLVLVLVVTLADLSPAGIGALLFLVFVCWQVFFARDPLAAATHGADRTAAKAWLERVRRVNMADGTNSTGAQPHEGTSTEARTRTATQTPSTD